MSLENSNATKYAVVTPSDTTVVAAKGFYVNVTGDLALQSFDGASTVTFEDVPVGLFPVGAYRVMAATTATVVALY